MGERISNDPRIDPRIKALFAAPDLPPQGDVTDRETYLAEVNSPEAVAREAMDDPTPWLKGLHEHYLRLLEELLRSGQSEGAVRTGLSPRATAAVIAAMGCTPSLEVEAYLEHLMEVLRKGVEP